MSNAPSRRPPRPSRLPLLVTIVGVLVVVTLWSGLQHAERSRLYEATQVTAEQVEHRLVAWTEDRTSIVRFFADQLGAHPTDDDEYFETAIRLQELYPGFQALNRIDADGTIVVIAPRVGNEPALGKSVLAHPARGVREAFARAQRTGGFETSPPIPLFQGGQGVPTYRVIRDADGRVQGYVNGVFRVDTLVDSCLSEEPLRASFRFRLRGPAGGTVYEHTAGGPTGETWPNSVELAVHLFDQPWRLELAPTPYMIRRSETWTDEVLGLVGLALVALMGALLAAHLRRLEDLSESRARYRLIVENVADLIVKVDRDGRFLYVSPSYCEMFGRTEESLLGKTFLPLVHEDDRADTEREFRKVWQPPHTAYMEQRAMTARGWRWLAWSDTGVLDESGNVEAVLGVGRDITERKELEDQLRHSQKMQAVGELAGGVAHDFNNILQAMMGNLQFARAALPADNPAVADLARVAHGAERAARLTKQLLAFSRQEVLEQRPTDVNRLVEALLGMIRPAVGETVTVEFVPGAGVGPVLADPAALEQVVMNLCINARDAVGGTGTISLRTEERELDAAACEVHADATPGTWVVLAVSDDGVGLDESLLPRIFEPFFTTKERGRGTGLGLSTVYGIVRQHGGFLEVESAPGAGATFRVFLPRSDAPAGAAAAAAVPARPSTQARSVGGEVVLLAEDDESVRDFASRALRRAGYEVVEATDGGEAIARVEALGDSLHLALLDVVMPGTGGHVAARRIRELHPRLPILFMSGHDPDAPAVREQSTDPARFIRKPYTLESLLAHVREALDAPRASDRG